MPPRRRKASRPAWRFSLKDSRVRARLLLLIAVPTIVAVVFGGLSVISSVSSAQHYEQVQRLASLAGDVTGLVQALQNEREDTVTFITMADKGGRAGTLSANPTLQAAATPELTLINSDHNATDRLAAQVRSLAASIGSSYPALAQQQAQAAITVIGNLPFLRQAAVGGDLPALTVVKDYGATITQLLALEDDVSVGSKDAALAENVQVLGLISSLKEEAAQQQAILTSALSPDLLSATQLTAESQSALSEESAEQTASQSAFNLAATPAQRLLFTSALSSATAATAQQQVDQAISLLANGASAPGDPIVEVAANDASYVTSSLRSVEQQLMSAIIGQSGSLRAGATAAALVDGAVVLLILALGLLLTLVVGRSMIGPLRALRAGALEIAGVRLPETVRRMSETDGEGVSLNVEPIDVDSSDEIGEVARAFDQVHREALRLAANEAALRGNVNAMFVNLSRRSQSLVERQIRMIDDLEQGEQDPERLASLFQMDHLATRMRRNSENLLVLAGQDLSRRWSEPVALVDVLRAALSEIEHYERVTLTVQPGVSVRGQGVSDVVHLTAELVENATSFSAADTPVSIGGQMLSNGGALLQITDEGVGMSAEEMAHANWRLDNPPVVDVAASRRMGLFVVARLAGRHGIRVRLRPGASSGLVALVWLPDEAITRESSASPAGPRRPGQATGEKPPAAPETTGPLPVQQLARPPATEPRPAEPRPVQPQPVAPRAAAHAPAGLGVFSAPAAALEEQNRLPIFESVESDWFRRGRQTVNQAASAEPGRDWVSPADAGWRAAEVAAAPVSDGVTAAGLPRRLPKANLVPGTVRAPGAGGPAPAAAPPRSAAATRDRFASFQHGVRMGRAAAGDARSDGGEDEGYR